MEKIYLDNAATTRVCEQAAERTLYVMTQAYGNPSSLHTMGFEAEREMTAARQAVADRLSVNPSEIYFTSGGTEANNIALFGAVKRNGRRGKRIVTTAVEHPSVLRVMEQLEQDGFTVEYLMPDATGHISPEQVEQAITGDTILVSMMLVNNETGVRMPVEAAAEAIRRSKSPAILHVDAVQAFCKVPIKPARVGIDLMTVSSHKIHGPKGAGALYVAGQKGFPSRSFGGGQEREVRPGTEPLPAIAGFGAAVRAMPQPQELKAHFETLRAALREQLSGLSGVVIHSPEDAMPYVFSFSVPGIRAETMLHFLSSKNIFVSSGSACSKAKPSHVLTAMGLAPELVESSLRVSFSRFTTTEEIGALTAALKQGMEQLVKKS
ncbi:MAG: cysteine desulfurase family protein [Clostridium sp.]|uniref:cysteine desulfurase family protein n=1 Tax=Faecalispora jeddahensis TaxID=1414721 RepID=UPI0004AFBC50|nr:cysteine desulfurase family protein [Faecalispora jeddahensis]MDU6307320.1 cysteine desulfurase family protein [Clostridium sp.]MDU6347476.1 cysteine desulfurase family protein [Clostridium sp.]